MGDEQHCETYDGVPITDGRLGACPPTKTKQAARAFDKLAELFTQTMK